MISAAGLENHVLFAFEKIGEKKMKQIFERVSSTISDVEIFRSSSWKAVWKRHADPVSLQVSGMVQ